MTGAPPVGGFTYSRGCRHGSVQNALRPRIVQLPEWSCDRDSHYHWKEMTLQSHGLEGRRKGRRGGMGGEEEREGRRNGRGGGKGGGGKGGRGGGEGGGIRDCLGRQRHVINTVSFPCGLGMRHLEPTCDICEVKVISFTLVAPLVLRHL